MYKNINANNIANEQIKLFTHKLNTKPRNQLNLKTHYEIFNHFDNAIHKKTPQQLEF